MIDVDSTWDAVLLARHGETRWNLEGRRQGRADSALTAAGRRQAARNADALRDSGVDAVFVSPLGRAVATANVIGAALGIRPEVVDDFAEMDHGDLTGLTENEIRAGHAGEWRKRAADRYGWRFPGGESYADVDVRAGRALSHVRRSPARRPLIVSHEMIGRMLLRRLLGLGPARALALTHPHDVVYKVDPAAGECWEIR